MEEKEFPKVIKRELTLEDVENLKLNYYTLYADENKEYFMPNLFNKSGIRKQIVFRFEVYDKSKGGLVKNVDKVLAISTFPIFVDYLKDMVEKRNLYKGVTIVGTLLFQSEIKPTENVFIWDKKEGKWATDKWVRLVSCGIGLDKQDSLVYDTEYLTEKD